MWLLSGLSHRDVTAAGSNHSQTEGNRDAAPKSFDPLFQFGTQQETASTINAIWLRFLINI